MNLFLIIGDWLCSLSTTGLIIFALSAWIFIVLIVQTIRRCLVYLYIWVCRLIFGDDVEFYWPDGTKLFEGGNDDADNVLM